MGRLRVPRSAFLVGIAVLVLVSLLPRSAGAAGEHDGDPTTASIVGAPSQQVPVANGDLTWQFAPRGVFVDSRVVTAFVLLLDEAQVMSAAGLSNTPLYYGDPEVRSVIDAVPAGDAPLLLAAAGVFATPDGPAQIEQARRCRIWTPQSGDSLADRQAVRDALGDGLVAAFAQIGVTIAGCEPAASAAEADVSISLVGLESGLSTFGAISDDSFVQSTPGNALPRPGTGSGGTGGTAAGPQPADTGIVPAEGGSAGLLAQQAAPDVQLVAAALALGLLLFGGRWLSGERNRAD